MKILYRFFLTLFIGLFLIASFASARIGHNRGAAFADGHSHTFNGRRGSTYIADWDPQSYQVTISTSNGAFPWDWISFVGKRGAISLAGHANVAQTFGFSDANSLSGLQAGDIMRVKTWDRNNLTHLTKLGLVIGSGPSAERAWFGDGNILEYYLAPDYIGYKVEVLGRTAVVHLTHLQTGAREVTGVISVTLDDPDNAWLYVVSDLEPSNEYQQAVEFRNNSNTHVGYDIDERAVWGQSPSGLRVYLYSSSPLVSWSAHNDTFNTYLQIDELDGRIKDGFHDAFVAFNVSAAAHQYFYIGNIVLSPTHRQDPSGLQESLRSERMAILSGLPIVEAPDLPGFDFVTVLSNLFLTYLVNPGGNLHYTDKVFPYTPDNLMLMIEAPHILPEALLNNYRDYLSTLSGWQYTSPGQGAYWWRAEVSGNPPLPDWYAGNIPDMVFRTRNDSIESRLQYSDLFGTAEYLMSMAAYYRATGDTAFVRSFELQIRNAIEALKRYNSAYDTQFGEDGHLYPHLIVPMSDLYLTEGVYPAESAMAVYGLEDAALLLELMDDAQTAEELLENFVEPMRSGFSSYFWVETDGYLMPRRDARSSTGSGDVYRDFWAHTIHPVLRGDLGKERLSEMLAVYTGSPFHDADFNYRWLSSDSENYRPDSYFKDGYVMAGGFFNGAPNVAPAIGYYQLGDSESGDTAAQLFYFDVWTRMGPYETMRQWDSNPPGLYLEASIYVESLVSTLWLIKEALRLEVDGDEATIAPVLGGSFNIYNLNIVSNGKRVVLDYGRDDQGCEYINIKSNSGLNIQAPQTLLCDPAPIPTSTELPPPTTVAPTEPPDPSQPSPTPTPTSSSGVDPGPSPHPTNWPTQTGPGHPLYLPLIGADA
jgi:hypothetical protein